MGKRGARISGKSSPQAREKTSKKVEMSSPRGKKREKIEKTRTGVLNVGPRWLAPASGKKGKVLPVFLENSKEEHL